MLGTYRSTSSWQIMHITANGKIQIFSHKRILDTVTVLLILENLLFTYDVYMQLHAPSLAYYIHRRSRKCSNFLSQACTTFVNISEKPGLPKAPLLVRRLDHLG